ncbi:MAG: hypothetical protein U0T73_09120 [Chitinophagales bacterium]
MATHDANKIKILIGVIAVLLVLNGVTLYLLVNRSEEKAMVITEKTALKQTYDTLESQYNAITDSLDNASLQIGSLKGKNADLDKIIAEKQAMIDSAKSQLAQAYSSNTLTVEGLNKARRMITQYEVSINGLQKKVDEYAQKNQQLTEEKAQLFTDLNCEKETTQQLTDKITEASYLSLPAISVEAIRRKNNGTEAVVSKAKHAESLKISFEIGANKALDPGSFPLYVRIINPRGETITVDEQGSGVIPGTETASKPIKFTKKTNITWNQKSKKVVVYWTRYINAPGNYRVEIYQGQRMVGKGAVLLA